MSEHDAPFHCYPCARGDHDGHKMNAWEPGISCECPPCAIPYQHGPHLIDDGRLQNTCPGGAWACLACRANEAREDVAQFEAPCEVHAVEMSRRAEQAERRAEEAECHVEQLKDGRDRAERRIERAREVLGGWEHDGPDDPAIHLLIQRVREALGHSRGGVGTGAGEGATGQDTGTAWVTRSEDCPEAPAQAHPSAECPCGEPVGHADHCGSCCGCSVASEHEHMATVEHLRRCPICDMRFTRDEECAHHWLDRPESDTRECLICGTEAAG